MKSLRISTIPHALLLVQLALACSAGTEVGNGVKPSDPNPSPQTATNASASSPETATVDASTVSAAGSTAPGVPIGGAVAVNAAGSAAAFSPVVERIFTNCASPFGAATLASPVVLSHKSSDTGNKRDNKINATFASGTQTWKISDANSNPYRQLVLDQAHGTQAIIAHDAGFQTVNNGLTCSSVTTDPAATLTGSATVYTKLSVNLTNAQGQVFPLTWYLLVPGAGAPLQLKRIDIGTGGTSAPFILETE